MEYTVKIHSLKAQRLYNMSLALLAEYQDEDEIIFILIECINQVINAKKLDSYEQTMKHRARKVEAYIELLPLLLEVRED